MHVFILSDLEGIPFAESIDCVEIGSEAYLNACRELEKSINRTAEACRKNGADEIYYLDGHNGGGNVNPAHIVPYAVKCSMQDWENLLKEGRIDCQIELGAHTRPGTIGGFLDHVLNSKKYFAQTINGREQSEVSRHALLCAHYGVPIAAVIGDEAACVQAAEYIPDTIPCPVKIASCRNRCTTYPDAYQRLDAAVEQALQTYPQISLYQENTPAILQLTYYRTDFCEEALERASHSCTRIDARTLQWETAQFASNRDMNP